MTTNTVLLSAETYPITGIPRGWSIGIDTGVTTDFSLITNSTCNVDINWGDGSVDTDVALSGQTTTTHNYSTPGTYTVEIDLNSGDFYPFYNNNVAGGELVTLGDTPDGWSFGLDLTYAFRGASNLTSVSASMDTSAVTNFTRTWQDCSNLTDFPLINTSSGTQFLLTWLGCNGLTSFPLINISAATSLSFAWSNCTGLTSFPLLDTSLVDNFPSAWQNCSGLLSFPAINTSSGTNYFRTWQDCSSLTSFPLLDTTTATSFRNAWSGCSSLVDFPPNFFDPWEGVPTDFCLSAWGGCSSLTATSVENILNSLAASAGQQIAPASGKNIFIDYNAGSGTPNITTAVTNLKARDWTILLNSVAQ